jgi:hypothetical protein
MKSKNINKNLVFVIPYLFCSFIEFETNPANWDVPIRMLFALFMLVILLMKIAMHQK